VSETLFKVVLGGALVVGGAYLVRERQPARRRAMLPSDDLLPSFESRENAREAKRPYEALCTGSKRSWCNWRKLPSAADVMADNREVYCPRGMHWKAFYSFPEDRTVSVICFGDASITGDIYGHKNLFELMLDTGRILTATGTDDLARKLTQYGHSMLDVEYDERAQEAMDLLRADDDTES